MGSCLRALRVEKVWVGVQCVAGVAWVCWVLCSVSVWVDTGCCWAVHWQPLSC
jgi:energy-converting hydrogenase Eha subunit G